MEAACKAAPPVCPDPVIGGPCYNLTCEGDNVNNMVFDCVEGSANTIEYGIDCVLFDQHCEERVDGPGGFCDQS